MATPNSLSPVTSKSMLTVSPHSATSPALSVLGHPGGVDGLYVSFVPSTLP